MIIDDLFFINWLIVDLSRWSLILFSDCFFRVLSWSNNFRMIDNIGFSLLNIDCLFDSLQFRLYVSLSNSSSSWYSYWNGSGYSLIINNWSISNLFGVDRSRNFSSSYNWCLNDLLFNDWLRDNFSSDNWLRNNLSFDNRLRNDLLSLSDFRFWVKYLIFVLWRSLNDLIALCWNSELLRIQSLIGTSLSLNFCKLSTGDQFLQIIIRKLLVRLCSIIGLWIQSSLSH